MFYDMWAYSKLECMPQRAPLFLRLLSLALSVGSYYNGNNQPYTTPGAYYTPTGPSACSSGCMTSISSSGGGSGGGSYTFQAVSGGHVQAPNFHLG